MSRTLNSFVGLNTIAIAFLTAVLLYVGVFEKPFLTYPQLPFKVLTPVVHAGETVKVEAYRCNSSKQEQTYLLTHKLVNLNSGEVMLLKGTQVQLPTAGQSGADANGCSTVTSMVNEVPAGTPPGTYIVSGIAGVDGTIRNFNVRWYTEPFEVVPNAAP